MVDDAQCMGTPTNSNSDSIAIVDRSILPALKNSNFKHAIILNLNLNFKLNKPAVTSFFRFLLLILTMQNSWASVRVGLFRKLPISAIHQSKLREFQNRLSSTLRSLRLLCSNCCSFAMEFQAVYQSTCRIRKYLIRFKSLWSATDCFLITNTRVYVIQSQEPAELYAKDDKQ